MNRWTRPDWRSSSGSRSRCERRARRTDYDDSVPSSTPERSAGVQTTSTVLMIRPARFGANPETAASNAFQRAPAGGGPEVLARARAEFDALVDVLRAGGVEVCVVEDTDEPEKPDAVFPNNWVSFHAGG